MTTPAPPIRHVEHSEIVDGVLVQHLACGHDVPGKVDTFGRLQARRQCLPCAGIVCHRRMPPRPPRPAPNCATELAPIVKRALEGALISMEGMAEIYGGPEDSPIDSVRVAGRGRRAQVIARSGRMHLNVTAFVDLNITGIADARRWGKELAKELGVPFMTEINPRKRPRLRLVGGSSE